MYRNRVIEAPQEERDKGRQQGACEYLPDKSHLNNNIQADTVITDRDVARISVEAAAPMARW